MRVAHLKRYINHGLTPSTPPPLVANSRNPSLKLVKLVFRLLIV